MQTEWVILADHAEVVNGKLYLMGGGWETLTLNNPDMTHSFGLAVAFSIPWNETNQPHNVEIMFTDDDSTETLAKVEATLEVGRPPGVPRGQSQLSQMAINMGMKFKKWGGHVVIVTIEGVEPKRFPFRIEKGNALAVGNPFDRE